MCCVCILAFHVVVRLMCLPLFRGCCCANFINSLSVFFQMKHAKILLQLFFRSVCFLL